MESLNSKVELLEKTLTKFQAEVDMKMKIMERLFSNRTEQVAVQKKLLEEEETLYQFMLTNWKINLENSRGFFDDQEKEENSNSVSEDFTQTKNYEVIKYEENQDDEVEEIHSPQVVDLTSDKIPTSVEAFSASRGGTTSFGIVVQEPVSRNDFQNENSDIWKNQSTQGNVPSSSIMLRIPNEAKGRDHRYFPTLLEEETPYHTKLEPEDIEISDSRISIEASDSFIGISSDSNTAILDHFVEKSTANEQPSGSNALSMIIRHSMNSTPFKCEVCGKCVGSQTALRHHLTIHQGGKKFPCNQCGKQFPRKGSLERHKLSHEVYKTLRCYDCPNVQFSGKEILVEHMESHHGIKKPWMCNFCRTCFAQRKKLQQHILVVHPGLNTAAGPFQKRIPCSMCSKTYSTRNDLMVHIRSHTGERPFSCSGCQKSFADRRNMKKHMETCLHPKR